MSQRPGARHARPSQVLTLPDERAGWGPPAGESATPPAPRGPLLARRAVIAVAGLIGLTLLVTAGTGGDRQPVPELDVATTDAVVDVLRLYEAEVTVTGAAAAHVDLFAVPGPAARARQLRLAAEELRAVLTELRSQPVAAGTPGASYVAHPDHDAVLALTERLAVDAALLGFLGDVHDSLYRGTGVVSLPQARERLVVEVLPTAGPDLALHWGRLLVTGIDGAGTRDDAEQARLDAAAEWATTAERLGPADGADLAAFLNGIDPAVLDVLDGHPVAGPPLRRLR